jgi:arylsulfatase A-like enzyme
MAASRAGWTRRRAWLAIGLILLTRRPADSAGSAVLGVVERMLGSADGAVAGPSSRGVPVTLAADMRLAFVAGVWRATTGSGQYVGLLDLRSRPFTIPPAAVLTYAVGVDQRTWTASPPVRFTVTLEDDRGRSVVQETILDPAAHPDDRSWRDVRVSLDAFAGRTATMRFAASPITRATGWSVPVWADPTVWAPRREAQHINVILISLDTLRAGSVSAYGCARETTPSLDRRIGAKGTVFDDAMTTAPHTLASHLSLMTGVYPNTHGGASPQREPLDARLGTLPQSLRMAGYETVAFTEDGWVLPLVPDRRGFARYVENTKSQHPSGTIAETFGKAIEWLRTHHELPFFLFLHTYEVHTPYLPLPPYDRMFIDARASADPTANVLLRYESEVRYADDLLAALLDELDALGLGIRTLVVVVADHGEEFWEHGGWYHGQQLYAESIDVPFMMRLPGVVPEGRRIGVPVSLVDVAPTILDLLGAPPITGAEGVSLTPLLRASPEPIPPRTLFAETGVRERPGEQMVAARTSHHHCVARPDQSLECYDRSADPGMYEPLPAAPGASWLADVTADIDGYRRRIQPRPAEARTPLDSDREKKLRALGYVE